MSPGVSVETVGGIDSGGYRRAKRANGDETREHVLVAERAFGKRLPPGVEVHHVDGDRAHNINRNLVICQDKAFHRLLHARTRIVRAGGNPNTDRICCECKRLQRQDEFCGAGNQCRACNAERTKAYRTSHADSLREYEARRRSTPERAAKMREYRRRYAERRAA